MKKESSTNEHLAEEAAISIIKAKEHIYSGLSALLKEYGLTEPLYNVLRILRGAGKDGIPCLKIRDKMLTRVPDVTRLLDRLEKQELIIRERDTEDRRIVFAKITVQGKKLLSQLDSPVRDYQVSVFSPLTKREVVVVEKLMKKLVVLD